MNQGVSCAHCRIVNIYRHGFMNPSSLAAGDPLGSPAAAHQHLRALITGVTGGPLFFDLLENLSKIVGSPDPAWAGYGS